MHSFSFQKICLWDEKQNIFWLLSTVQLTLHETFMD